MATKEESIDWFLGKARTATGYRNNLFKANPTRHRSSAQQGRMYFFHYDPKLKLILPIYDRFPLVFPLDPKKGGFLGLNIHYLSGDERMSLLGGMMKFANNKKNDKTTKLNVDYDLVSNLRSLSSLSKPCIKHYLYGHVRSPFIEITADEWEKVINLPVELFISKK